MKKIVCILSIFLLLSCNNKIKNDDIITYQYSYNDENEYTILIHQNPQCAEIKKNGMINPALDRNISSFEKNVVKDKEIVDIRMCSSCCSSFYRKKIINWITEKRK